MFNALLRNSCILLYWYLLGLCMSPIEILLLMCQLYVIQISYFLFQLLSILVAHLQMKTTMLIKNQYIWCYCAPFNEVLWPPNSLLIIVLEILRANVNINLHFPVISHRLVALGIEVSARGGNNLFIIFRQNYGCWWLGEARNETTTNLRL